MSHRSNRVETLAKEIYVPLALASLESCFGSANEALQLKKAAQTALASAEYFYEIFEEID